MNEARLKVFLREHLREISERLAGMLRTNDSNQEWQYNEDFLQRTGMLMDDLVREISFLVLERASQRSKDAKEFIIVKQDVLDAFDMYRASKKE